MTAMQTASDFFHACEGLGGWEACKPYVADHAGFSAQCEPLVDIDTVEGYCEWMAGLGRGPLQGCSYEVHSSAWDETSRCAIFFATFTGTHVGEGGPLPPTGKTTHSHYVYVVQMDGDDKVCRLTKIWNAPWALGELGWA